MNIKLIDIRIVIKVLFLAYFWLGAPKNMRVPLILAHEDSPLFFPDWAHAERNDFLFLSH